MCSSDLCYKCHDRTIIMSSASWTNTQHHTHVQDSNASCSICHDVHGVSASQGTTTNNRHMINFDTRFVLPYTNPTTGVSTGPIYVQTTAGQGSCTLTCHGRPHNNQQYPT